MSLALPEQFHETDTARRVSWIGSIPAAPDIAATGPNSHEGTKNVQMAQDIPASLTSISGLSARADEAELDRAALWQEIHRMRTILVAVSAVFGTSSDAVGGVR